MTACRDDQTGVSTVAEQPEQALREPLAALLHTIWGQWTRWQIDHPQPEMIAAWEVLLATPYAELGEQAKEADRREADRVLDLLVEHGVLPAPERRQSAEAWLATPEFAGQQVLDPDGWNREADDWAAEWATPLTHDEFFQRLSASTAGPRTSHPGALVDPVTGETLYEAYIRQTAHLRQPRPAWGDLDAETRGYWTARAQDRGT